MTDRRHSALVTQLRVLFALMLREMITRYGRSSAGYLWALVEPVGFIALLSVLFSQIAHLPPVGRSFVLFYATGYIAFHVFNDIAAVTGRSVHVNRPLLCYPAVTALDTVLARFILQTLTALLVAFAIIGGVLVFFEDAVRIDPARLMLAFFLAAILGLGVGVMNVWLFALSKSWELAWGILSRPLFLISCVFFTFESLPAIARDILWYNPLIHLVGLTRAGIYPIYDPSHVSAGYVLFIALGLCVIGIGAIRRSTNMLATP